MENLLPLIVQLVSGAAGGNAAGSMLKNLSLGTIGNSIVGILGGGIGGKLLGMLGIGAATAAGADAGGMDLMGVLSSVAGGGIGGGVLLAIVGMIKKAMNK